MSEWPHIGQLSSSIDAGFVDLCPVGLSALYSCFPLLCLVHTPTDSACSFGDLWGLSVNLTSKSRDRRILSISGFSMTFVTRSPIWGRLCVCVSRLYSMILHLQASLLISCLFFFAFQLLSRGYARRQSSIIILVVLEVKLDLAGHKGVLFLLRQATGTDQVRTGFAFYSIYHHWTPENFLHAS